MKILFASQDVGGCNCLIPVIKYTKTKPEEYTTLIFSAKRSVEMFQNQNIKTQSVDSLGSVEIKEKAFEFAPNIIMLGTSMGRSVEDDLVEFARAENIPTISIIDSWMNYVTRYSGENVDEGNLEFITDKILVNDKYMKEQAIAEGLPKEKIIITGNPYLLQYREYIKPKDSNSDIYNILFISQPCSEAPEKEFPYDEIQVLEDIIENISLFCKDKKVNLLLRPHPRGKKEKFFPIIEKTKDINLLIDKNQNLYDSINEADLIVGMDSIVLVESIFSGKEVICYQPGISPKEDMLITSKVGLENSVYSKEDLKKVFEDIFFKNKHKNLFNIEKEKKIKELTNIDAIENIINVIDFTIEE